MKIFSRPISSPSRVEKFPPPLMTFVRSSGGNRSRGRSRSSPAMFIRKKNETAIETQEPTSPKVTCMGQVRVRKSKQTTIRRTARTNTKSRCQWIGKDFFFNRFDRKPKPRTSRPFWGRWFVFFQVGYRKKVEIMEETARRETKREETDEYEDTEVEEEETVRVFVSSSPPKNALFLMRCRSEPHRASSLANRFWDSPSAPVYAEQDKPEKKSRDEKKPELKNEPFYGVSLAESRTNPEIEEKLGFSEGYESSSNENSTKSTKMEDNTWKTRGGGGSTVRPLILTKCKSVPAIRSGKLVPDTSFWKKRLGFVGISSTRFY